MMCLAAAGLSAHAGDDDSQLVVNMAGGGDPQTFAVTDIRNIQFSDNGFTVMVSDGTVTPFSYSAVRTITFGGNTNGIGAEVAADAETQLYFRSGQLGAGGWKPGRTARATVCDTGGRTVLRVEKWDGTPISTGGMAPGVYVFSVDNQTIKFVK